MKFIPAVWLTIGVCVIVGLAWAFGFIPMEMAEMILSVVGVGGFAGLAALINSSGYKRWITVGIAALAVAGNIFGFLSPDTVKVLLTLAGVSAPLTFGHAIAKTPEVGAALKSGGVSTE